VGTVKKKFDLDSQLVEKIQLLYGDNISLTYLVESLLWALVRNTPSPLSTTFNQAAKDAREEISLTSEIRAEES